jgi:integrase
LEEIARCRGGRWSPEVRAALDRLMRPLKEVLDYALELEPKRWVDVKRDFALWMDRTRLAYWGWSLEEWRRGVGAVNQQRHSWTPALLVCYLLCGYADMSAIAPTFGRYPFAVKVFGPAVVDAAVARLCAVLAGWGYQDNETRYLTLRRLICDLLLRNRSPRLEDITATSIADLVAGRTMAKLPEYGAQIARALCALGVLDAVPSALDGPVQPRCRCPHEPDPGVPPAWAGLCQRWYATSTLTSLVRYARYRRVLKIARWQAATYPAIASPAEWTRELAAACVAAIDRWHVGDWSDPLDPTPRANRGKPLAPASKEGYLIDARGFFRDCQEWEWIPRRFDPARAFATPRSLRALIGPRPRVLADDIWAKLMWAGLHLEQADVPIGVRPGVGRRGRQWFYPLELIRAVAVIWLFAGLRNDEIRRLRVGCVRWQRGAATAAAPAADAVCWLDVPVNKTGGAFTKPVDRVVGEAVAAWEAVRPEQPLAVDAKTNERVDFLFVHRGKRLGSEYINGSLIPLLCRKGGVPLADARGTITSHRARATIASQLYNAKEGMELFELQEWLGHRSPEATRYYVKVTPTKLAKSYQDAEYFARNVRLIEVLIDQDVVVTGTAARGEPWKFYDLGHGYCTYDFYAECPHRMACARCSFYVPKGSTYAQLVEGKAHLLRMKQELTLTDEEVAAVEEGVTLHERLLARLTDVPTPAGPTPYQLSGRQLPVIQRAKG